MNAQAQTPSRQALPRLRARARPHAEQLLERLEEHQRDLEQEVADVADLIRRLKEQRPETASV